MGPKKRSSKTPVEPRLIRESLDSGADSALFPVHWAKGATAKPVEGPFHRLIRWHSWSWKELGQFPPLKALGMHRRRQKPNGSNSSSGKSIELFTVVTLFRFLDHVFYLRTSTVGQRTSCPATGMLTRPPAMVPSNQGLVLSTS